MFNSLKEYILRRMIGMGSSTEDYSKYDNRSKVKKWVDIYEGNPYWISDNPGEVKVVSRNMAASVASELARKVTIEMDSHITGDERAEYLDKQYQRALGRIRSVVEQLLVQGSAVLKPFVYNGQIGLEHIRSENFIPLKFNDMGELVEVVFIDRVTKDSRLYTRLETHKLDGTDYTITNKIYLGEGITPNGISSAEISLSMVEEWSTLASEVYLENIERPLYSYIRTPFANNEDISSPLGVSVLSKIDGLLRDYDTLYSGLLWEFEGGTLKVFMAGSLLEDGLNEGDRGKQSGYKRAISTKLVKTLNIDPMSGNSLIDTFNPAFRVDSYNSAIQSVLRRIEFGAGLGYGDLSEVSQVDKTAEEIRASKERSYSTIVDIQKTLERSLTEVAEVMSIISDLYELGPDSTDEYDLTFHFDDSIVSTIKTSDKKLEWDIAMAEANSGYIKPEIYLMKRYGVTLEEALDMMPSKEPEATANKEPEI